MERRKDSKGRVLKEGEKPKKRWSISIPIHEHARKTKNHIRQKTLRSLRELEEIIQEALKNGDVVFPQKQTLSDLLKNMCLFINRH